MSERTAYTCLYTHQLAKKVKSFKDGLLDVRGVGVSRRFALFAALDGNRRAGEPLETGPLPADAPAASLDGAELRLEGYLVQVESLVTPTVAAHSAAAAAARSLPLSQREPVPAKLAALPSKKRKAGLSLPPGVVPAAQRLATQPEAVTDAADWAQPDWLGASRFASENVPISLPLEPEPAQSLVTATTMPQTESSPAVLKAPSAQRMMDWDEFLAAAPVNEEDQPQAPPSQAGAARALQALSAFGVCRMMQFGRGAEKLQPPAVDRELVKLQPPAVDRELPAVPSNPVAAAVAAPVNPLPVAPPRRSLGFSAQARGSASALAPQTAAPSAPLPLAASGSVRPAQPPPLVLALPAAHIVVRGASVETACRVCGSGGAGRAQLHSNVVCRNCYFTRHALPDLFSSVAEYCDAHARALLQEICFGLTDISSAFWGAAPRASTATAAERQRLFRTAGVPYYGGVDLIIRPQGASAGAAGAGPGAGGGGGAGEPPPSDATLAQLGAYLEDSSVMPRVYIRIASEDREPASKLSLGDIWIISSSPAFAAGGMPSQAASWLVNPAPSSSAKDFFAPVSATTPFTLLARSGYHAVPPGSGMLELVPLGGAASAALERSLGVTGIGSWPPALLRGPRSIRVVALRGPCLLTEPLALSLLGVLRSAPPLSVPLASLLAQGSGTSTTLLPSALPRSYLTELVDKTVSRSRLNDGQGAVIRQAASWFTARGEMQSASSPCLLVRGVFGSGKSKTLAALLSFLSAAMEESEAAGGPRQRVLVCSATNVAVDRVLTGLIDVVDSADVARVGSLRRISRNLLQYALPSSTDSRALAAAASDLRALLSEGYDGGDKDDVISKKISGLADSAGLARLSRARVIGVTAASAGATTLADARFDVVILDEATQLTESTALLAIARYGSTRIVLAGDPAQLPPVVFTIPAGVRLGDAAGHTIETSTLFARLNRVGGGMNLPLLTQYRLHPRISRLVSGLFYGGQIRDGVHAGHCPPRFRLCPRVLWFDYSSAHGNTAIDSLARTRIGPPPPSGMSAHSGGGGSLANNHEADVIAALVREMLAEPHRVPPSEIFVICLYRAQVGCVTERLGGLAQGSSAVRVGTVDASQGAEFSVVIISTSITSPNAASENSSGHVHSPQRVCVALSRARSHLIVVGSASALCASAGPWRTVFAAAAGEAGGLRSTALRPLLAPGPRLAVQSVIVDEDAARA